MVVSEHLQGSRLSDLLDGLSGDAAETQAAPGLDAALGFLLEVLPALAALHASAGFVHGAVGAGRTVITPGGEVVLLDWVYGHILARLGWSPARLWRELGIAVPSEGGPGVVDAVGDIAQAALTAALLVTGRPLPLEAQAEGLAASLPEMVEIAQIRGSQPFAAGIERFLHRALLLPGSAPFTGAEEAADAVRRIAAEIGDSECRAALAAFSADSHRAREQPPLPALVDHLAEVVSFEVICPVEEPVEDTFGEPEIDVAVGAAARAASAALEFEVPLDVDDADADADTAAPALPVASDPEPIVFDLTTALPAPTPEVPEVDDQAPPPGFGVSTGPEPVDPVDPVDNVPIEPEPVHHDAGPVAPPPPEPVASATPTVDPPAPEPDQGLVAVTSQPSATTHPPAGARVPGSRRKRHKAGRGRDAAPTSSPATPPISSPPREVQPPAPPAFSPAPPRPAWQTEAPAAMPYYPSVSDPREPTGLSWSAPMEPLAPAAGVQSPPVPAAAPVRIKPEKPAGYAPAPRARDREPSEGVTGIPYVHRGFAPQPSPRWKIGAAAAAVAAVVTAGVLARHYLPNEKPVQPAPAAAATLAAPPQRHQLTFTNRDLGYSSSQTVDIEAGEERSSNLQPTGTLNLNALPWADVWIDGKKVGDTPVAGLRLPLGIHDIVFRHPQLGERTMTTTVRADTASAASVDFTKAP